jgi:hypothetical protein
LRVWASAGIRPVAQHDNAIGDVRELLEVRGREQDGRRASDQLTAHLRERAAADPGA